MLSGGRLTLGIGAGWLEEEFVALQTPPFAARGKVTDEYLLAAKELWTAKAPRFEGEHVRFADLSFEPKPVQPGGPPIWVGGESGPAIRRTARLGDAWYPIGTNPSFPLDSLARYQAAVARLRKLVAHWRERGVLGAEALGSLPGVEAVHHLHVWGLSTSQNALTAHISRRLGSVNDMDLLHQAKSELAKLGIAHSTIQLEPHD
jgi:hypothetical protein